MLQNAWHKQGTITLSGRSSVSGKDVVGSYLVQDPEVQPSASGFHHQGAQHQPQVLMPCQVVVDPEKDRNVGIRELFIWIPAPHAATQKET